MSVTAESLFREVFLPLYPEDAKSDLGRARSVDANPANNPTVLAHLDDAAAVFVANAPSALGLPAERARPRLQRRERASPVRSAHAARDAIA